MHKLFHDDLLNGLKNIDPFVALQKLCDVYHKFNIKVHQQKSFDLDNYNTALNAYAFLLAFGKRWKLTISELQIGGSRKDNFANISRFVSLLNAEAEKMYTEKMIGVASEKYDALFGNEYHYEFEENDYKRVQDIINELRDLIRDSNEIPEEQKDRLVKRLDQLQSDLDKRVSNFDRFWGVAIEISSNVGQICENVKPFNDRLKELLDIVTKTMKIATGTILLEPIESKDLLDAPDDNE